MIAGGIYVQQCFAIAIAIATAVAIAITIAVAYPVGATRVSKM